MHAIAGPILASDAAHHVFLSKRTIVSRNDRAHRFLHKMVQVPETSEQAYFIIMLFDKEFRHPSYPESR